MAKPAPTDSGEPEPTTKQTPEDDKAKARAEAEANFNLKSLRFWSIIISIYVCIFLVALDRLIIATAIPLITDRFDSINDIGWYISAYTLTAAIFNPLSGRIYQLYPTKAVFLGSLFVFEVGSAVCGAAPSSVAFIIGRAIAGIGAAGIFTGGIMIIIPLVPLHKRPVFTSFFGLAFGVASVVGPLIGGAFSDNTSLTWRWCFYINLPFGGLAGLGMIFMLHLPPNKRDDLTVVQQLKRLDPLGLLFFAPSMICLILALQWGGTTYAWSDAKIIGLLVTFVVALIIFIFIEGYFPETAMLPARVVLQRSITGSIFFTFLTSGAMMSGLYYLATWFQAVQGQSAVDAGIRTLPLMIAMILWGIITAVAVQKIGYYNPALLLSVVLSSVGFGLLSTLTPDAGKGKWIGYQILCGLGVGTGFQTAGLVSQTVLPRKDVPIGMALTFFMQQLGGSVFTSVGENLFLGRLVHGLSGLPGLTNAQDIVNSGATTLRQVVAANELPAVLRVYSSALDQVFILAAALSAATLLAVAPIEWRTIKKKGEVKGEEAKKGGDVEMQKRDSEGEQKA